MAVTQLKDGRWICYYRFQVQGSEVHGSGLNERKISRIKKEYFGRGAGAEARAWARNKELNLQKRKSARPSLGPLFQDLVEEYVKNKIFSKNSQDHLEIRLNANILPAFGNLHTIHITDQHLDNYVQKRRNDGVKYTTIHYELTIIQAILNWSASRKPPLIPANPVRGYKKPERDDEIILPPTREEINRILAEASPHLKRAIMLSYFLGLRPGDVELLSLTWPNVNRENETILVISAHKGGVEKRMVPIHKELLPYLKKWAEEDQNKGHIVNIRGRPIHSLKTSWKGALRRAKIGRRLRLYDLRHHFVTRALEQGGDIKALAEVVGSRPETLMKHYQHVTSAVHRKIVGTIPPLP